MEYLFVLIVGSLFNLLRDHGVPFWTILAGCGVLGLAAGIFNMMPHRTKVTIASGTQKISDAASTPPPEPTATKATAISRTTEGGMSWIITTNGDGSETWELDGDDHQDRHRDKGDETEIAFLKKRLDEELRAKWQTQNQIVDPNTVRLSGRVARIDKKNDESLFGSLWMAIPDLDGEFQGVKVQGAFTDLPGVTETDMVTLLANWKRGRLTWVEIESTEKTDEPMPELNLPDAKGKDASNLDGKLPTMTELDKAAREGDWGALNHSVYRFMVPVHITFSPKYRAKVFTGRAAEVQAICRQVAEAEGLMVIAVAAEDDHLHLLGIPAGAGGQPPTWVWSKWVGRFKALTSKKLKSLEGLEAFQWQTGYAITAVHGGKQGAEQALEMVKRYVENQGHQDDEPSADDDPADN